MSKQMKEMSVLSKQVQCLNAIEIFCDLSTEEIAAITKKAPVRYVEPKTIIYFPEQPGEVLFMLSEGQIQLYQLAPDGRIITNAILTPGTLFGEMALLGQSLRDNYALAVTSCVLCTMTVTDVKNILLADIRISNRFLEALGKRLLEVQRHFSVLTFKLMPNRVAWALLHLSNNGQNPEIRCTHETLASMVGANRETVTKILNDFQAENLVRLHRARLTIVDVPGLTELERA